MIMIFAKREAGIYYGLQLKATADSSTEVFAGLVSE